MSPVCDMSVCGKYVYNMYVNKCHQRDGKFPPLPPLKAPPLIKHSMGLFKKPGALQNTLIYYPSFKFLIDISLSSDTWLSNTGVRGDGGNTETKTICQTVKRGNIYKTATIYTM